MTRPEEVAALARAAAEQRRAEGDYAEVQPTRSGPAQQENTELKLYQWAFIEPDISQVRSTRRWGQPITLLKRLMLRLLAQWNLQLIADQVRFNVMLLGYVRRLEQRIAELEAKRDGRGEDPE